MHKLRVQLLMFLLCGMQSLLHGMENELNKTLLNTDDHNITRDVIISSCLANHDYHTYRNIAMVSKAHNRIIEDKYRVQKKELEELTHINNFTIPQQMWWNKDFSRCAWINMQRCSDEILDITLVAYHQKQRIILQSAAWGKFKYFVDDKKKKLFFDQTGAACVHGVGEATCPKHVVIVGSHVRVSESAYKMFKYGVDVNGKSEPLECMLGCLEDPFSLKENCHELVQFLDCPDFLEAVFQSTQTDADVANLKQIYFIEGAPLTKYYDNMDRKKRTANKSFWDVLWNNYRREPSKPILYDAVQKRLKDLKIEF